ncbi:DUF4834 family protein [Algibacter miyuki]|uniref:DUF4834 family protein n=1 Tax=Algibacter miyuki TaxID=1306933 RepID=A0ABV5GZ51_9FLAO|nr:DUF4834 family protein [Algibacter miyuki]MDN3666886.1 DUF4834 family protein [Algibacter miyuki]
MGLLKTIFIIVLVYYLFKVVSRIFGPLLMKFAVKKAGERFGGQYQAAQKEPVKKEGEVTIDKIPNIKTSNKDVGDYVDYEEVD